MKIGIDIDGVLIDLENFLRNYATKYNYENEIKNEIKVGFYEEGKVFGWTQEQVLDFWEKYLVYYVTKYPTREFAKDIIKKLKETNEIYIITARNEWGLPKEYVGRMQELTKKWLAENEIEYDKIIFSGEEKLTICIKNQIDIMIDDSPYVLEEITPEIQALCFDESYNKNVKATRVYSWYDILEKIRNIKRK